MLEPLAMLVTASDGARLHVHQAGEGTPMVLAHGGPGLWDYLDELSAILEAWARVIRYDQRGGGRSDGRGPYEIDRFVADFDDVRRSAGADRVVAAGHSWGASLALLYAARHPEHVRGVLYVSGAGCEWSRFRPSYRAELLRRLGADAPRFTRLEASSTRTAAEQVEQNRLRWSTDYVDEALARPRVQRMLDDGFEVNAECNRVMAAELIAISLDDWATRLRAVQCPVLIVAGAADPRPVAAVDSLVALLPNAQRCVLPDAGHFPWVEQPERFATAVHAWSKALGPP
jgi:proline iminopeptidase